MLYSLKTRSPLTFQKPKTETEVSTGKRQDKRQGSRSGQPPCDALPPDYRDSDDVGLSRGGREEAATAPGYVEVDSL